LRGAANGGTNRPVLEYHADVKWRKGFEDFIRLVVDARVGGEAEASPVAMMHVRQRTGVLIARCPIARANIY
jgi:hypothetical protein